MTDQQTRLLSALADLADLLADERTRLIIERAQLLAVRAGLQAACGAVCWVLDLAPGEFQARADAILSMIESLELFVGERLPRVEAAVAAGDLEAGLRALESGQRITGAVVSYSPLDEVSVDVNKLARDIRSDIPTPGQLGLGLGALAVAGLGLLILTRR